MTDFREKPIVEEILPHTGRKAGDDSGYRGVATAPEDEQDPDSLVVIAEEVAICYPVYAAGWSEGLSPYYGDGIGGPSDILVRAPVAAALAEADKILEQYDRELIVLDGFRPARVQAALWRDVLGRVLPKGKIPEALSIYDLVFYGFKADDIGSYAPVTPGKAFERALQALKMTSASVIVDAAHLLGMEPDKVAEFVVIFRTNLGFENLPFDESGNTAHGGGGAVDVYLYGENGIPTCLGVPFDFNGPASAMTYFEYPENIGEYRNAVKERSDLAQYLGECGVKEITPEVWESIRAERRILFHTMMSVGATHYCGECWHFNLGNVGGKQFGKYPNGGNSCHSLLQNVRDESGQIVAVWGNKMGHELARGILGKF